MTAPAALAGPPPAVARRRTSASAWGLVLPLMAALLLLYLLPLANILWISVTDPAPGLGNYQRLADSDAMQRVLWTTFRVAAWTTLCAVVLGYLVAYVMLHASPRHRVWITAFVLVPFWVSVLVRAFAWLTLLRSEGLVNGALAGLGLITEPLPLVRNEFGVLVGMVHYMVPYAVLPLYAGMKGIDPALGAASRSLGAGPLRTFARVFLPLSLPGIFAASLLVFVLSLGFLVSPAILGGGKVVMIAEYVRLQIFQTVRWGVGTMMASVLLLSVLALIAMLSRVVDVRRLFGGGGA
jgi:putative spermidine/putrescine transport system permease protein